MKTMHHENWSRRRFMFIPAVLIGLFGLSALIMFLWNLVIPVVLHVSAISYWQAMGLFILSRILFGRFHFHGPDGRSSHFNHPELKDKLLNMTDEERTQFKEQWKQRCGR